MRIQTRKEENARLPAQNYGDILSRTQHVCQIIQQYTDNIFLFKFSLSLTLLPLCVIFCSPLISYLDLVFVLYKSDLMYILLRVLRGLAPERK